VGKNEGGLVSNTNASSGQSSTLDLNDPNNALYSRGIIGNDSKVAFRLSGSYEAPGDVLIAGSLISNGGYPYASNFNVTRSIVPGLVRSTQTVFLSARGDERLPSVTLIDLRISRAFRFAGNRRIVPQFDIFNLGNAATIVSLNSAVGGSYRVPSQIVAPRIMQVGFAINF